MSKMELYVCVCVLDCEVCVFVCTTAFFGLYFRHFCA